MLRGKKYKKLTLTIVYIVLGIAVFSAIFPVSWMILSSFKTRIQIFSIPPTFVFKPTFSNYQEMFAAKGSARYSQEGYLKYILNSLIIATFSTLFSLLIGSLAAYSLSRFRFWHHEDIAFWILSTRMAPAAAAVLPFYLILKTFHLLDTQTGLILVYTVFNLAFVVWMMRSFFNEIPRELDEASMIDGCSRIGSLIKVIFPLASPGFVATAVFCMIFSWNEFYFALILTGTKARTLPVAVTGLITPSETLWGLICAIGSFMFIPLLIFAWFLQRYLLRGLTFGAIK
jgi:multiple sugar transport system permease protein